jgi:hypothetical protein
MRPRIGYARRRFLATVVVACGGWWARLHADMLACAGGPLGAIVCEGPQFQNCGRRASTDSRSLAATYAGSGAAALFGVVVGGDVAATCGLGPGSCSHLVRSRGERGARSCPNATTAADQRAKDIMSNPMAARRASRRAAQRCVWLPRRHLRSVSAPWTDKLHFASRREGPSRAAFAIALVERRA